MKDQVLEQERVFKIKPSDIDVSGQLLQTFGVAEVEDVALKIVKYMIQEGDLWNVSFSIEDLENDFGIIHGYGEYTSNTVKYVEPIEVLDNKGFICLFEINPLLSKCRYKVGIDFIVNVSRRMK